MRVSLLGPYYGGNTREHLTPLLEDLSENKLNVKERKIVSLRKEVVTNKEERGNKFKREKK